MTPEATTVRIDNPSYQAYQVLHIGFTVFPIIAGADKFFHFLVNWDMYLAPIIGNTIGIATHTIMLAVGVIEVIAGLLVAIMPRFGGWIVGLWLCGIIVNLLLLGNYFEVALRDLGLALGAFALARMSVDFSDI